jgi:glucose-6-phosphate 1-dehydrogenase
MALKPKSVAACELIIKKGDVGREMYALARGEVEVLDDAGKTIKTLKDGDFFGEIGILMSTPRTASVRAKTSCDLFVLDKAEFSRILRDYPQFASNVLEVAKQRYNLNLKAENLLASK